MLRPVTTAFLLGWAAVAAHAETLPLPRRDQLDLPSPSVRLALDPCFDLRSVAEDVDAAELHRLQRQQATLPKGSCQDAALADQLFQFQLLQNALLSGSAQPWAAYPALQQRQQSLDACATSSCLQQQLSAQIPDLWRALRREDEPKIRFPGLCRGAAQPVSVRKIWRLLRPADQGAIRQAQAESSNAPIAAQCHGAQGQWLWVTFPLRGN